MQRGKRLVVPDRNATASAVSVTRKVDAFGNVRFPGTTYRAGNKLRCRLVQVAVVGDTVEISLGERLIPVHKIRHDRTREHGAFANLGCERFLETAICAH